MPNNDSKKKLKVLIVTPEITYLPPGMGNIANKLSKTGLFSMALFKDTETCPLYESEKNKGVAN